MKSICLARPVHPSLRGFSPSLSILVDQIRIVCQRPNFHGFELAKDIWSLRRVPRMSRLIIACWHVFSFLIGCIERSRQDGGPSICEAIPWRVPPALGSMDLSLPVGETVLAIQTGQSGGAPFGVGIRFTDTRPRGPSPHRSEGAVLSLPGRRRGPGFHRSQDLPRRPFGPRWP